MRHAGRKVDLVPTIERIVEPHGILAFQHAHGHVGVHARLPGVGVLHQKVVGQAVKEGRGRNRTQLIALFAGHQHGCAHGLVLRPGQQHMVTAVPLPLPGRARAALVHDRGRYLPHDGFRILPRKHGPGVAQSFRMRAVGRHKPGLHLFRCGALVRQGLTLRVHPHPLFGFGASGFFSAFLTICVILISAG